MAITKIGPPLAGIRGTIGGIVFSENKSATYARIWSRGSNPRTTKQSVERGYLSQMPALWNALTDVQRAAWRTFAADPAQELENSLGDAYYASGYNWFCKSNVRLLRVGRATIQAIPAQARPAAPTILEFRVTPANSEVDQCTCGVATASSERVGSEADKAFDDNLATQWTPTFGVTVGWLQYVFCAPVVIRKYRIYTPAANPTHRPKDWLFQVANNGGWDTIDSITDFVFADDAWTTFFPVNAASHDTYRINIWANNGDPNTLRIQELEMYLGVEDASHIHYSEDNFDNAPDYDLVLHVSMGNSIGMGVQYPGFYETLALQSPGRHYELCQTELESIFGTIIDERSWFAQLHRQTREGLRSTAATERTVTE